MADTTIKLSGTYDSIEAYELLEEMRGVASDYLPLTGGEISGDLIVDGQISGDVTGTASGNLPLSGGTMTGGITLNASNNTNSIQCSNMSSMLYVWGGGSDSSFSGSTLILSGINSSVAGKFYLRSPIDSNNFMQLEGNGANGSLQWNSKEVERVNATSTNYIRYESGLQLCWGTVTSVNSSGVSVTFPVSFSATPAIMLSTTASSHCYYSGGGSSGFTAKSAASSATVIYLAIGFWK